MATKPFDLQDGSITSDPAYEELGRRATRKAGLVLLPVVLITGMFAYIDRTNLAYAAIPVARALKLTLSNYGFAAGILYLSYCFFQVPSQLVCRKVGAPIWLGVLVVAWGIVAACTAAIKTRGQFYALRFLLGVCEAGTFPAMFHHLSLFFSQQELSMMYAIMLSALSLSQVIGGPIAGGLQYLDGKGGLHGWQWLFVIEGAVTVLWGLAIPFLLPASPAKLRLLSPEERNWLVSRQHQLTSNAQRNDPRANSFWRMFVQWRVWYYALLGFLIQAVLAGSIFFVPSIVDSIFTGRFNGKYRPKVYPTVAQQNWAVCKTALISAILYSVATVATVVVGWSSHRFRERNWHIFSGLVVGGIAFMCVPYTIDHSGHIPAFVVLCIAAAGVFGIIGPPCAWVVMMFHGFAREVGFAMFNAIGGVGAFSGPTIIGRVTQDTGNWRGSLYFLGACCLLAAFLALVFRPRDLTASNEWMMDDSAQYPRRDQEEGKEVPDAAAYPPHADETWKR